MTNPGGVEPGEKISVHVRYHHPVDWQNGGGRLTVPLVVAPHFVHGDPLAVSKGRGFSPDTDQVPDASLITPAVAANPADITYKSLYRCARGDRGTQPYADYRPNTTRHW